ncbi:MAG: hypothetical protein EBZ36_02815 [Acidobacteria bacterium]|nr:hypothetical protein [Acidobacteriota bacterium]
MRKKDKKRTSAFDPSYPDQSSDSGPSGFSLRALISRQTRNTTSQKRHGLVWALLLLLAAAPVGVGARLAAGGMTSDYAGLGIGISKRLFGVAVSGPGVMAGGSTEADKLAEAIRLRRRLDAQMVRQPDFQSRMQDLRLRTQSAVVLPVIVRLRTGFIPEGELNSPIEAEAQRFLIQEAQYRLLNEVTGFDNASVKKYKYLPFLAMRVTSSGLGSLLSSSAVIDVQEDIAVPPVLAQSVALIGGDKAWAAGYTGAGQTVAVIDTGVDKNHPFLAGKVVAEGCYSTNAPSQSLSSLCPGSAISSTDPGAGMPCGAPGTGCDHGTHVAGIVAGRGPNFSGVAKDASIIALQVFTQVNTAQICGSGRPSCILAYDSDIVRSLERVYELRNTYQIAAVNLSLGGGRYSSNCDSTAGSMKLAIDLLRSAEIATIAASGNNGYTDAISLPACISTAISVGSTSDYVSLPDQVSSFSNSAAILNLLAPGEAINSSVPGGGYGNWGGTSMAAPHVAGAWAIARQKEPTASIPKILGAFASSGVRIIDSRNNLARPRIQVDAAIQLLGDNGPSPSAPVAPSSLTATPVNDTRIDLSWNDNSPNENGFRVRRRAGTSGEWVVMATLGPNVTVWQQSDAVPGMTYYYTVTAFNSNGESAPSNEATATTTTSAPIAPTNLAATARSSTRVDLRWNDNSSNETGFRIERRIGNNGVWGEWEEVATVGTNTTFFQNSGLQPGSLYTFRVAAFNSAGSSASSNTAAVTTPADDSGEGQIAAPGNLQGAAVSPNQINLTWVDRSENESGFRVRRKIGIDGEWSTIGNLEAGAVSFENVGLVSGLTYYYHVVSWNSLGESPSSNEVSVTAPNNSFTPLNNGLVVRSNLLRNQNHYYQINVPIGATRLAIQTTGTGNIDLFVRYSNQPLVNVFNCRSISNSSSEQCVFSYPTAGDWHVMIVGFSNNVSFYNLTASFQAGTAGELPAAPSNLTARVSSPTQVSLGWIDNSSNELLFRIRRRTDNNGVWVDLPPVQQNTISYLDNTVTPGVTYYYSVTSLNGAGTSAASNEVSVTTNGVTTPAPNAPGNLVATTVTGGSGNQVNLTWADNSSNESGFRMQRRLSGASSWTDIATLGANTTAYQDALVNVGLNYLYRVIAFNESGDSAPSNEVSVAINSLPVAPGNLRVALGAATVASLTWTDNSANETGFRIWRRIGQTGSFVETGTVGQNITSQLNPGLAPGTTYTYRVTAFNSLGDSAASNEVSVTTPDSQSSPPSAPTGLTAGADSPTRVRLSWVDVSDNESGFRIRRRIGLNGTYTEIGSVASNVNFYIDSTVVAGMTVFYRVISFNAAGSSSESNEASATTPVIAESAPVAPSELTATANSATQVSLTWNDNSANESGFRLERQNADRSGWTLVATVGANVTVLQNTGLNGATSYIYRAIAFNATGDSPPSNEATVTTPEMPASAVSLTSGKSMSGVLQRNQSMIYRIQVPANTMSMAVQTKGLGNVDLYLRHGSSPQVSRFDCRSNGPTSNELCTINRPVTGEWFVLVLSNFNSLSLYSIAASVGSSTPTFSELPGN